MFDRRSKFLSTVTLLQDLAVTCVSFGVAYWLRTYLVRFDFFSEHLPGIYPFEHYIPLMVLFLAAWAVVGYSSRFYRDLELSNPIQLVLNLLNQLAVVLVIVYAGLYLSRRIDISRTYVILVGVVDLVLLVAARYLYFNGIAVIRRRLNRYHYFLIVGTGARAHEMARLIRESSGMGLRLVGFVDLDQRRLQTQRALWRRRSLSPECHARHFAQSRNRRSCVRRQHAGVGPSRDRDGTLRQRGRKDPRATRISSCPYSRIYLENFRDVPLLSLSTAPESELLLLLKRIGDVVVAALSLVLFSPLLLVIAAAIRITSPGDVLFRQTRCGLGGRRFMLYKFRSMVNNAEQLRAELLQLNERDGPVFKMSDDPRITSVGRILRRFSLDELPQLWNILRGDMSFVGPRPAIPNEVVEYEPWQRRRLRMRPGLTCIWVLEGRSDVDFHRWIQLDLDYIDNWSLWLDCKIFFRTIPIVISGRGAY